MVAESTETLEETIARADAFRTFMAAREDCATTLVVSHWAFILALTGISARNGEILELIQGAEHRYASTGTRERRMLPLQMPMLRRSPLASSQAPQSTGQMRTPCMS